ncbi:MAG: hypothetical protein KAR45_23170 [Desulfobacteraceae bacterium]|nr:hypothetical protein [Desulfobacteraceae bacterium]
MEKNTTQIYCFDTIRDDILASLYSHDYKKFEKTFSDLLKKLKSCPTLSENAQKSLYQINAIAEKFKKADACADLNKFLKNQARLETKNPIIIGYNTWKTDLGIDDQTLKILFSTTINLQLSTGCSNYCKRCNEWALPGVRKHFSYNAVIEIAKNLARENNKEYALYSASDPLDWKDDQQGQNKDITHLMEALLNESLTPAYGLLTKVPKGKELIFKQLIKKK